MLTSVKCFEHFFESRPNELAAFKLEGKILEESNLKRIGIFMSNLTVITLYKKSSKRAMGRFHVSNLIQMSKILCLSSFALD